MNEKGVISAFLGAIAAAGAALAHVPHTVQILAILMVLDILLGGIHAAIDERVSSSQLWRGLAKKSATILLLAAIGAAQPVLGFDAMPYAGVFFIAHELVSITEHAAALGVPIPERVQRVLVMLRGDGDGEERRHQAQ